jgi:hypothetical protein
LNTRSLDPEFAVSPWIMVVLGRQLVMRGVKIVVYMQMLLELLQGTLFQNVKLACHVLRESHFSAIGPWGWQKSLSDTAFIRHMLAAECLLYFV